MVGIWIDNRTDKPIHAGGGCYLLHDGDVFDELGHRLTGIREQQELDAQRRGQQKIYACASTLPIASIPAHTCKAELDAGFPALTLDYNLSPGRYYIFPVRGTDPALFQQRLMITVREPGKAR